MFDGRLHQIFNRDHIIVPWFVSVSVFAFKLFWHVQLVDWSTATVTATPQGYIQFQPINGTSFSFDRWPVVCHLLQMQTALWYMYLSTTG